MPLLTILAFPYLLVNNFTGAMVLVFVLFALTYIAMVAFEARQARSRYAPQTIVCPENGEQCEIDIDARHASRTAWRGERELRLRHCDRWPEKKLCGQECLLQVEVVPAIVNRVLDSWYAGKRCTSCLGMIRDGDWTRGRAIVLRNGEVLRLKDFVNDLPAVLQGCRPLCHSCGEKLLATRPEPERLFRHDPRQHRPALGDQG